MAASSMRKRPKFEPLRPKSGPVGGLPKAMRGTGEARFDRPARSWQTHRPLVPFSPESTTLAKPDLGTKRVCPSCASRFYDLQKRPIECPKCAFTFEPEALLKQRRTRVPEPVAKPAPVVVADDEEVEEAEDEEMEEEATEGEDEAEEAEAPEVVEEAPVETEDAESEDGEPVAAEDTAESEDDFEDEIEDEDEEEDDTLLEEVEEDEDDVSGIIDADIEKDEP